MNSYELPSQFLIEDASKLDVYYFQAFEKDIVVMIFNQDKFIYKNCPLSDLPLTSEKTRVTNLEYFPLSLETQEIGSNFYINPRLYFEIKIIKKYPRNYRDSINVFSDISAIGGASKTTFILLRTDDTDDMLAYELKNHTNVLINVLKNMAGGLRRIDQIPIVYNKTFYNNEGGCLIIDSPLILLSKLKQEITKN
jgi:hypothetical protein